MEHYDNHQQSNHEPIQQPQWTQPQQVPPAISVGEWIGTIIITAIPIVGFIMLLVWAFSATTNPNKANWAKAQLLFVVISIFFVILFWGTFASVIFSSMF